MQIYVIIYEKAGRNAKRVKQTQYGVESSVEKKLDSPFLSNFLSVVTQKEKENFQYKRNIYCPKFASPIFFSLNITLVTHGPLFFFRLL